MGGGGEGQSIHTPNTGFLYGFVFNMYGSHVLPVPSPKGHKTKNGTSAEERAAQKEVSINCTNSGQLHTQKLDLVMVDQGIN